MNTVITEVLFWSSIAALAYVFAGYPLVLAILGAVRPKPWRREPVEPAVSIVIAAYNEAPSILRKVENLLSLDYPADRFEILIGSDGSTDATIEQLLKVEDPRVHVFMFAERRGKPAVLNTLVANAKGEIVVLADVRQTFDTQVLRALTRSFADPQVGAVTGELILKHGDGGNAVGEGSGAYWRYEKFIRSRECVVNSTVVVTGAIYAIRKSLFEPIAPDTICDDLLIPLRIGRKGYRVVFEREALAFDVPPATSKQEFTRKVRTLGGAFQFFARERWVFNPFANPLWFETMSHKALRLLVGPLQLIAFAANITLALESRAYTLLLAAQILFYAGAIGASVLPRQWKRPRALTVPYIFCLLSWATLLGFLRWVTGRQSVTWEKAAPLAS